MGARAEAADCHGEADDGPLRQCAVTRAQKPPAELIRFVAGPDGRAHRVSVTIGVHDGRQVQVLSGIKAGDRVITSGGYALSDGLRIRIAGLPS